MAATGNGRQRPLVLAFVLLAFAGLCQGLMECTIQMGMSTDKYGLSSAAKAALRNRDNQAVGGSVQVFDCTCDNDQEFLEDQDTGDFDDDEQLFSDDDTNGFDWKESIIFYVHDCDLLAIRLTNENGGFASELSGAAIIFENIKELEFGEFELGLQGDGDDFNEGVFSSIYFRHVMMTKLNSRLDFEDKTDVLFHKVMISDEEFLDVRVTNTFNMIDPVITFTECKFQGVSNLENGLSTADERLRLEIANEQRVVNTDESDNNGCELDYKGRLIFKNNDVGVLNTENLKIDGGMLADISDNYFAVVAKDSILVDNVKELRMVKNTFAFSLSQPMLALTYARELSNCDDDEFDLPEAAVRAIVFDMNHLTNADQKVVDVAVDNDYSVDFLRTKLSAKSNTLGKLCDCKDYAKPGDIFNNDDLDDSEKIHATLMEDIQCQAKADKGELLIGKRKDICEGRVPRSAALRVKEAKDDLNGKWALYLAIAVVVTFLITLIATIIIMKFFCGDKGEITPRSRA